MTTARKEKFPRPYTNSIKASKRKTIPHTHFTWFHSPEFFSSSSFHQYGRPIDNRQIWFFCYLSCQISSLHLWNVLHKRNYKSGQPKSIYLSIVNGTSGTNLPRFIQKLKESTKFNPLFLDKILSKGCSQISLTYKRLNTTRRRITLNIFQSCSRHLGCFCTWGSADFLRTIWLVTLADFSQSETCLLYVINRRLIAGVFQFFFRSGMSGICLSRSLCL